MLTTELTRRLGLRLPIIGAPMAGAGHGELARAVSSAGGLGMVGAGNRADVEFVRREAAIASDGGRLPFGIGLHTWALPGQPGVIEATAESGPTIVSLSFGPVDDYLELLHSAGSLVAAQVNTVADARIAVDSGVDIVVAQGSDAGGHTGSVSMFPLLQGVLEALEGTGVPVLAAGGIGTGRGLAAVLAAGAQAGWVGTRLLACREAEGSAEAKKRVLAADETDTVLTRVFDIAQRLAWPERYPGRALRNATTDEWHGREGELVASLDEVAERVRVAQQAGDFDTAVIYAGQAVGLVHDERSATEVVTQLAADAERHLAGVAGLIG